MAIDDPRDDSTATHRTYGASNADLRHANLIDAKLSEAKLRDANLSGAALFFTKFNNTTCPDGTHSNNGDTWERR